MKPLFIKRLFAYILDFIIVALLAVILLLPFTNQENLKKNNGKISEFLTHYRDKNLSNEEFNKMYNDLIYENNVANGGFSVSLIFVSIAYYGLLQYYLGGRTLGKKVLRLKVISNKGKININDMIIRSLMINYILYNLISFSLFLLLDKKHFLLYDDYISTINRIIMIISSLMMIFRLDGRGLHDLVASTQVVNDLGGEV